MKKFQKRKLIPKPLPSYELLHCLFIYDPETGHLYINDTHPWYPAWQGKACSEGSTGYRTVHISNRFKPPDAERNFGNYLASRVIWKMICGTDPEGVIDHINGIRDDNRPENLRDLSPAENAANRHGDMWKKISQDKQKTIQAALKLKWEAKVIERWQQKANRKAHISAMACSPMSLPG